MGAPIETQTAHGSADSLGRHIDLRNMAGLRAQLARATGNLDQASDLLQDAIVTALQKLRAGEITDPAHLDGYVYRVALNHLRNRRRKDKLRAAEPITIHDLPDQSITNEPEQYVEAEEWAHVARRLMQEVGQRRDRELLVRFYLHEETKEDLCRAFNLTELHFNRVIHRARDRFRELLERRGMAKADLLSLAAVLLLAVQCLIGYGINST